MVFEMPVLFKMSRVTGDLVGGKMEYLRAAKFTCSAYISLTVFHFILTAAAAKIRTFLIQYRNS